jgi:pimeloyl-ACP methyl ester carboxylesterase
MPSVTSSDGTTIAYTSTGAEPGLIPVPGALTVAADFAPRLVLKVILRLAIRRSGREQKFALLRGTIREHREAARLDGTAERYRQIPAQLVLMSGRTMSRPGSPVQALAELLPDARLESLERGDHFAPEKKPALVAQHLRAAFADV